MTLKDAVNETMREWTKRVDDTLYVLGSVIEHPHCITLEKRCIMTKLATICYIDNGKELLLLHRNKKPNDVHEGKWISVGGKLESGETPDECARREIFEETHLTVKKMDFKGMITFPGLFS